MHVRKTIGCTAEKWPGSFEPPGRSVLLNDLILKSYVRFDYEIGNISVDQDF